MDQIFAFLFWPILLDDERAFEFAATFLVYGAYYIVPFAGLIACTWAFFLTKLKRRKQILGGLIAVSLLLLAYAFFLSPRGELAFIPILKIVYLPLGPMLLLMGLLSKFHKKRVVSSRASIGLIIAGALLTYLLTVPWTILLMRQ